MLCGRKTKDLTPVPRTTPYNQYDLQIPKVKFVLNNVLKVFFIDFPSLQAMNQKNHMLFSINKMLYNHRSETFSLPQTNIQQNLLR